MLDAEGSPIAEQCRRGTFRIRRYDDICDGEDSNPNPGESLCLDGAAAVGSARRLIVDGFDASS